MDIFYSNADQETLVANDFWVCDGRVTFESIRINQNESAKNK